MKRRIEIFAFGVLAFVAIAASMISVMLAVGLTLKYLGCMPFVVVGSCYATFRVGKELAWLLTWCYEYLFPMK